MILYEKLSRIRHLNQVYSMTLFFQRDEPRELRNRVPYVILILTISFSILLLRFWYLQIYKGKEFRELSENNRIRLVRVNPFRGMI